MSLLSFWDVLRSQKRIVAIGVGLTLLLSAYSLFSVSSSGLALRSPPVYVAKATLYVTQDPRANAATDPSFFGQSEYQAGIFAQLAYGDAVRRLIDPTLERKLNYQVAQLKNDTGATLPLILISGYATKPSEAIALANLVARSLRKYAVTSQAQAKIPERRRSHLALVARPLEAEVFQGLHLTGPGMLFVLGMAGTIFLAFTRHNLALGRQMREQALSATPLRAATEVEVESGYDTEAVVSRDDRESGASPSPVREVGKRERWKQASPGSRRSTS